jgi:hypothetical protein
MFQTQIHYRLGNVQDVLFKTPFRNTPVKDKEFRCFCENFHLLSSKDANGLKLVRRETSLLQNK